MKKREGFTLIELLAVIVILGVIMIIAIPSVTSYITNSRKDSMVADAKMFIGAAKTQLTADGQLPHSAGEIVIVPVADIALDKGGEKSPFGNDWVLEKSFVAVENIGTSSDPEYVWKVALEDVKGNCIPLTEMKALKRNVVGTGCEITNPGPETLYDKVATNAVLDTSIDLNGVPNASSSGNFIRTGTENSENPVYYYRGIVTNNNVRFANFCWKIVRTTSTGGVKLIYNGVPAQDGSCNNTGTASQLSSTSRFNAYKDDNAYIGYMYGTAGSSTYEATHANVNNSLIKTAIDNWYQSNMTAYTSKLEDTEWCNDRSLANTEYNGNGTGQTQTNYAAYPRNNTTAPKPLLSCPNVNDRFTVSTANGNGALTYPVGLLTADEATMAGSGYNGYSSSSYLYTGQLWWLLSPFYYNNSGSNIYKIRASGQLTYDVGSDYAGVRPAISLKPGTVVTGDGDGTASNPYVVE